MNNFVSIGSVVDVNPSIPLTVKNDLSQSVSFLSMSAISETGQIIDSEESFADSVIKGYRYFETGDILFAKITPCMENGKAVLVENIPHRVGFGSTEFHVLRPSSDVDGRYLFYMIWNPMFRHIAAQNMTGTAGQRRVPTNFIKRAKIPLPPLEEQKRIAAILDKADAIRRARKEAIALTEELLRSTFLDMFGDPVTNPKGWEVVKLEKILGEPFQNGAYFPKDKYSNGNNSIEMIHMSDAFYGVALPGNLKRVLASKKEIGQYGLTEGDVLINRRSLNYEGSAKPCLIPNLKEPLIFESSLIRVRVNRDIIDPIFFYSYMLQPRARAAFVFPYVTKSTISGINQTGLKQVKLTVPPIELQLQYKQFYNQVTCTTIKHENSLERINNLFNSLLQKAFRGEL